MLKIIKSSVKTIGIGVMFHIYLTKLSCLHKSQSINAHKSLGEQSHESVHIFIIQNKRELFGCEPSVKRRDYSR